MNDSILELKERIKFLESEVERLSGKSKKVKNETPTEKDDLVLLKKALSDSKIKLATANGEYISTNGIGSK